MMDYKVTQEMKRHVVVVAIYAIHTDLEISTAPDGAYIKFVANWKH